MNIQENFQAVLGVTTLLLLGACATGPARARPTGNTTYQYGVVQSIALVEQQPGQPSGVYKFTLCTSDGAYQALTQINQVDIRVGDWVRVADGVLTRYD
jgi:hypothetical protein